MAKVSILAIVHFVLKTIPNAIIIKAFVLFSSRRAPRCIAGPISFLRGRLVS